MLNKAHKNPEPLKFANKYNYDIMPESVCDELDAYGITPEERDYFANSTPENFARWLKSTAKVVH